MNVEDRLNNVIALYQRQRHLEENPTDWDACNELDADLADAVLEVVRALIGDDDGAE